MVDGGQKASDILQVVSTRRRSVGLSSRRRMRWHTPHVHAPRSTRHSCLPLVQESYQSDTGPSVERLPQHQIPKQRLDMHTIAPPSP